MKFTRSQIRGCSVGHTTILAASLLASLYISPASAVPPEQLQSLDTYFNFETNLLPGACSSDTKTRIQTFLKDSNDLVNTALAGLNNFKTDEAMRKNLYIFFGIEATQKTKAVQKNSKARFYKVQETLEKMDSFFSQTITALVDPPQKDSKGNEFGGKPYIFCDSTWLVETEDVYDIDGDLVPGENLRTYAGDPNLLPGLRTPTSDGGYELYAYWANVFKQYQFEEKKDRYPGNPPSWCKGQDHDPPENRFAVTFDELIRDSITFCDISFGDLAGSADTIAEIQAKPEAKTLGTDLDTVTPRSVTFFHELIHLVFGHEDTPDGATRTLESLELAKSNADEAVKNPDSYGVMAMSYYLTKNGPTTDDGKIIDWSTGIAKEFVANSS